MVNKNSSKNENKINKDLISWNNIFYIVNQRQHRLSYLNCFNEFNSDRKSCLIKKFINFNNKTAKCVILNNVSGSLRCGQLLALIGPSGVGKSTLLQILSGRRTKNVTGNVYIHSDLKKNLSNNQINKLSFIPQEDNHIDNLTVKETLIYASKLKNSLKAEQIIKMNLEMQDNKSNTSILLPNTQSPNSSTDTIYIKNSNNTSILKFNKKDNINLENNSNKEILILSTFTKTDQYHEYLVNEIIDKLFLENCSNTLVLKCSGGQKKRLSIALELLSQPKVIIMDEPTTGLDFSSALNCVQILKNLTINNNQDPPAIIISIHQPSSSVIKLFDKLYVLAKGGNCIFNGYTTQLVNYLNKFKFSCPLYFNPTDLFIQISSGEYGDHYIKEMTFYQQSSTQFEIQNQISLLKHKYDMSKLFEEIDLNNTLPKFKQIKILIQRDLLNSSRKPLLNILRFIYFTFFALFIYFTYNYDIGSFNGCFTDIINTSSNLNQSNYAQKLAKLSDNSSILFFITMFLVISSIMPAALTFPNEMKIFIKERSNFWYSALAYYLAKFITDIPSYVIFPVIFTCIFYPLTSQIPNLIRFSLFNLIVIINSLITRSIGMMIGSMFLNDTLSAVFVSTCAIFPFMLSAGFLIRNSVSTWLLKPFWYFSFVRYTFGCLIVTIYGWGRCSNNLLEQDLNNNYSNIKTDNQFSIKNLNNQHSSSQIKLQELALSGFKTLMSNYLHQNEMQCLIKDNKKKNFTFFFDLFNECDMNVNTLKNSMINNLTLSNLEKYDYSFILNYFELTNNDFSLYFLNLILIFAVLSVINYWILLFKVRKNSQY